MQTNPEQCPNCGRFTGDDGWFETTDHKNLDDSVCVFVSIFCNEDCAIDHAQKTTTEAHHANQS